MAYVFYLDDMMLPIPPESLTLKVGNQNKTVNLINTGEVNILKQPSLTEIEFDARLPNVPYPFAAYENGFQRADTYLEVLEKCKTEKKKFQFIVSRELPGGDVLFDTNIKVSLEEYQIKEDAVEGFDVTVSIKLKQYKPYGTQKIKVSTNTSSGKTTVKKTKKRTVTKKKATTYTVKRGDCLWNIAKKIYGDGAKWRKIYNANKAKISNPNLIYPGQVFKIP